MDTKYIEEIMILRDKIIDENKNKNRKSKIITMIKELREKEKDILESDIYINRQKYTFKVGNASHTI